MSRIITEEARKEAYVQESDKAWITLLTITHENLLEPIRLSSDGLIELPADEDGVVARGVISREMTFIEMGFEPLAPADEHGVVPHAKISFDNVDRRIIENARRIDSPAKVRIEVILSSNPDIVQYKQVGLFLRSIEADVNRVEGSLSRVRYDQKQFPPARINPSEWPGSF